VANYTATRTERHSSQLDRQPIAGRSVVLRTIRWPAGSAPELPDLHACRRLEAPHLCVVCSARRRRFNQVRRGPARRPLRVTTRRYLQQPHGFSLGYDVASLWVGAVRVRPAGCLPGADAVEDLIDEFCGDRAGLQNGSIEDWSDQQAEASCGSTGLCSSSFVPASSSAACRRWVCEVALDTANASFDAVLVLEAAREWSPRRDWFGAHTRDTLRPR
jgi:hypothetical protein